MTDNSLARSRNWAISPARTPALQWSIGLRSIAIPAEIVRKI